MQIERRLCAAALAAFAYLAGCSPDVPETLHYTIDIAPAAAATAPEGRNAIEEAAGYEGWTVEAAGEPLGVLQSEGRVRRLVVAFDRPASDRPSRFMRGLALRRTTACGRDVVQPLPDALSIGDDVDSDEYVAERMEQSGRIAISVRLTEVSPGGARTVRVDWGGVTEGPLHIGETEVAAGATEVVISTLGCASPIPVRIGDRRIGELDPAAEAPFVSVDPAICHRFARQSYSDRHGGRREEQTIRGAAVVALPEPIDHWMEAAPESIELRGANAGLVHAATRSELVRIPCPPDDAP